MWFRRFAVLFALLCGLAGTQAPEFVQQYRQRLGGALDEARRMLADFDADSSRQGLDRAKAVAHLEASPDALARDRGRAIARLQVREIALSAQIESMRRAGPFGRLLVAAQHFDPDIAAGTARNFVPATPLTAESALAGLLAFMLGLGVLHGIAWPARRRLARRRLAAPSSGA